METTQLSREAQIEKEEKIFRLLLRQLTDIQAQADKIISGNDSGPVIEDFARYSSDLKEYVERRVTDKSIREYARTIPDFNYMRLDFQFWKIILLPLWFFDAYRDYVLRRQIVEEVRTHRNKYASLEHLIRRLG